MDKQIYRLSEVEDTGEFEFFVCGTNDVEPYIPLKTIGAVFLKDGDQVNFDFDEQDIDSLIKYLSDAKEYIEKYNLESRSKFAEKE